MLEWLYCTLRGLSIFINAVWSLYILFICRLASLKESERTASKLTFVAEARGAARERSYRLPRPTPPHPCRSWAFLVDNSFFTASDDDKRSDQTSEDDIFCTDTEDVEGMSNHWFCIRQPSVVGLSVFLLLQIYTVIGQMFDCSLSIKQHLLLAVLFLYITNFY